MPAKIKEMGRYLRNKVIKNDQPRKKKQLCRFHFDICYERVIMVLLLPQNMCSCIRDFLMPKMQTFFLGGGEGRKKTYDHRKWKKNLQDWKSTAAYTSAKVLWSEVRRLVDNSFKVRKIIIKIRWEVRTSADWSCCAKTENSSGLDKSLNQQISMHS